MIKSAYLQFGQAGEPMLTKRVPVKEKPSKACNSLDSRDCIWMIKNNASWLRVKSHCDYSESYYYVMIGKDKVKVTLSRDE